MKRYFTAPKSESWMESTPMLLHGLTIFEPDSEPYDTGIIDKDGNSILAQFKLDQIGYVRR